MPKARNEIPGNSYAHVAPVTIRIGGQRKARLGDEAQAEALALADDDRMLSFQWAALLLALSTDIRSHAIVFDRLVFGGVNGPRFNAAYPANVACRRGIGGGS